MQSSSKQPQCEATGKIIADVFINNIRFSFYLLNIEQVIIAVTLQICIHEAVLRISAELPAVLAEYFVVFLCLTGLVP